MNKALFLDRDGTIIREKNYLSDPAGVELMPGAAEGLKKALQRGYRLFLLTNQSGVGRGWFGMEAVHACNQRMLDLLHLPEPGFTAICIAPESPREPAVYRKPSPRFINEMIGQHRLKTEDCFMAGDRIGDLKTALNAGITPVMTKKTPPGLTAEEKTFVQQHRIAVRENLSKLAANLP